MLTATLNSLGFKHKELFRDARVVLEPGTIKGLVSPNGHGKTTLLRAIAGDLPCGSNATVAYNGATFRTPVEFARSTFYASGEGMLYANLSPREHMDLAARLWGTDPDIEGMTEELGMRAYLDTRARKLSQGMRQQTVLAIAYVTSVPCLLLDEPMNALDPTAVQANARWLRRLAKEGTSVLMSSHILSNLQDCCDSVLYVHNKALLEIPVKADVTVADRYRELNEAKPTQATPTPAGAPGWRRR